MPEAAENRDPVKKPHDWDKAVSAAYLRLLGQIQETVADSVGISPRTLHSWEHSSWWVTATAEAQGRWLSGLEAKARLKLLEDMDANLALKIAERRFPALAPPTQRTDLTTGGEKIPSTVEVVFVQPDDPTDD